MSHITFNLILCDVPWKFSDPLTMSDVARGAESNYQTLTQQDLINLPVKNFIDPNGCVLASWSIGSLLQEGLDVVNAFGFVQKQIYTWVKIKKEPLASILHNLMQDVVGKTISYTTSDWKKYFINKLSEFSLNDSLGFGMGHLFRQTHEICLIGTAGKSVYPNLENKSQRSVSFAPNLKHSSKPEHLQDSLELMFPKADGRLELFARRQRRGWICLGNECLMTFNENITDSLAKLARLTEQEFADLKELVHNYVQEQELQNFWKRIK